MTVFADGQKGLRPLLNCLGLTFEEQRDIMIIYFEKEDTGMRKLISMALAFLFVGLPVIQPVLADEEPPEVHVDSDAGAEIVEEIESLREKNSDTFLMSDGTCECVIYSENKYYESGDDLLPIDNSIVEVSETIGEKEYGFRNRANSYYAYFETERPGVMLTALGNTIAFSLDGSNATAGSVGGLKAFTEIAGYALSGENRIAYLGVKERTDIVYSVTGDGVKEYIVLNSNDAPNEFSFSFDTNGGSFDYNEDGSLVLIDKNGEEVFELGRLFAVDSAEVYTDDLDYVVEECSGNDSVTIKIVLDRSFIDDPERVFPIVIDPSLMITGENNTYDSFVSSRYPTTNFYMNNYLMTGRDTDYYIRRTYIKFNLPSALSTKSIYSAYVNIKKGTGSAPSIKAYRVVGSWTSSSLTWNNKPSYSESWFSSNATAGSNNWYKLYVTSLVKKWLNGTYSNNGLLIKDDTESGTSQWTVFYSSDAPSPNKPELRISYSDSVRPYNPIYANTTLCSTTNCMGYALNRNVFIDYTMMGIDNTQLYGLNAEQMLNTISEKAEELMNSSFPSQGWIAIEYSEIDTYYSSIAPNHYRVALRVCIFDSNNNQTFDIGESYDYHWWYETSSGNWAEKWGNAPSHEIAGTADHDPASYDWFSPPNSSYTCVHSSCKYYSIPYSGYSPFN